MQTLVQVICSRGRSLRDPIVNDRQLKDFGFLVRKKQQPGRPRGWAKPHSTAENRQGALNIEWDADARVLILPRSE